MNLGTFYKNKSVEESIFMFPEHWLLIYPTNHNSQPHDPGELYKYDYDLQEKRESEPCGSHLILTLEQTNTIHSFVTLHCDWLNPRKAGKLKQSQL